MIKKSDFIGMYSIKLLSILVPFLLLPFLSRALDNQNFSAYLYAQVLAISVSTILEYGFNVNATRRVAQSKSRKNISIIISDVSNAKIFLIIPLVFVCAIMYYTIALFQEFEYLIAYVFLLGLAQGLGNSWYFQGVGKILLSSSIESAINLLIILLIIIYISTPDQAYEVLAIFSIGKIIQAYVLNKIMFSRENYKGFNVKRAILAIRYFDPMVMRLGTLVYSYSVQIISGILLSTSILGIFLALDRLVKSIVALSQPLSQILFPIMSNVSRESPSVHKSQVNKILYLSIIVSFLISCVLFIFSEYLVSIFLGRVDNNNVAIFSILIWQIPIAIIYEVVGVQFLLARGEFNKFTFSNFAGFFVVLIAYLLLDISWSATDLGYLYLTTSLVSVVFMLFFYYKKKDYLL
jgi:polysaccharide transporter, PST family